MACVLLTILGIGVLLAFFAPAAWVAYLGFALIGVGSSALFPLAAIVDARHPAPRGGLDRASPSRRTDTIAAASRRASLTILE